MFGSGFYLLLSLNYLTVQVTLRHLQTMQCNRLAYVHTQTHIHTLTYTHPCVCVCVHTQFLLGVPRCSHTGCTPEQPAVVVCVGGSLQILLSDILIRKVLLSKVADTFLCSP